MERVQRNREQRHRLIALLGHPVQHSKSPEIHNAAFKAFGLPYHYLAMDVEAKGLEGALQELKGLDFRGANITIPHKVSILPYLDEISPLAEKIGAVNTLIYEEGRLRGENTDGRGYLISLLEEFPDLDITKINVGIVGTGGAARAISFTLAKQGVGKLYLTNRNYENALQLCKDLYRWAQVEAIPFSHFHRITPSLSLLIHTTPVGMEPHRDACFIPEEWLHRGLIVSDLIYNPPMTKLLQIAQGKGAMIHTGTGMLVYQGALAFQLWTGKQAPIQLMKDLLIEKLSH